MRYIPRAACSIQATIKIKDLSGAWMEPAKWQVQMGKDQHIMVGSLFKRSVLNLVATEQIENDMRFLESKRGEQAWIAEKDYQRLVKKHQSFYNQKRQPTGGIYDTRISPVSYANRVYGAEMQSDSG